MMRFASNHALEAYFPVSFEVLELVMMYQVSPSNLLGFFLWKFPVHGGENPGNAQISSASHFCSKVH